MYNLITTFVCVCVLLKIKYISCGVVTLYARQMHFDVKIMQNNIYLLSNSSSSCPFVYSRIVLLRHVMHRDVLWCLLYCSCSMSHDFSKRFVDEKIRILKFYNFEDMRIRKKLTFHLFLLDFRYETLYCRI